jgi:hypothetical protein
MRWELAMVPTLRVAIMIIAVLCIATLSMAAQDNAENNPTPHRPPPKAHALQVVDANGGVVGYFTGFGCFVRQVQTYWVQICNVQIDGTVINEGLPARYYPQPNCQGSAFIELFEGAVLSRSAWAAHGVFEFVGDPVTTISVRSFQLQSSSASNTWQCTNTEEDQGGFYYPIFEVRAGPLQSFPLSSLGTPPFQVR